MRQKLEIAIPVIALFVAVALSGSLAAKQEKQDAASPASPSLQDQLEAMYKPGSFKTTSDSTGRVVVLGGTLLAIQKDGVMGIPPGNTAKGCTATYERGDLRPPKRRGRNYFTCAVRLYSSILGGPVWGGWRVVPVLAG